MNACLSATEIDYGVSKLIIDNTDYPIAEDEGSVFDNGADILVTVAGNVKFNNKKKIIIPQSLTKGLLGYRLLIIRNESQQQFKNISSIKELQSLSVGIPATWGDAEIFRKNDYNVVEEGIYDELFRLLRRKRFDYTTLGVNEIEDAFEHKARLIGGLIVEPSAMVYYPFPLVFYVSSKAPQLAERVAAGLNATISCDEYEKIFDAHHGDFVRRLNLKGRKIFSLENPFLADEMKNFKPDLLEE